MNMLDPEINRDKKNWTASEDATLVTAMEECRNEDGSYRLLPPSPPNARVPHRHGSWDI